MTKARVRVTWPQGKEWRNSPGGWQLPAACSVDLLIVTIPASKRGLFLATPGPAKIVTFRLPCGSLLIKPTDLAVSILICSNEVIMCWVSSQFQLVVDIFFFTFTPFIYLFIFCGFGTLRVHLWSLHCHFLREATTYSPFFSQKFTGSVAFRHTALFPQSLEGLRAFTVSFSWFKTLILFSWITPLTFQLWAWLGHFAYHRPPWWSSSSKCTLHLNFHFLVDRLRYFSTLPVAHKGVWIHEYWIQVHFPQKQAPSQQAGQ